MSVKGKYLNPKADLTFRLIFGEHADLMKSFLNALLPLEAGREIVSVVYANPELIPENPGKKKGGVQRLPSVFGGYRIVDLRCHDNQGREFIVEMQLHWNDSFKQRVMLNASKAVVKQAGTGEDYSLIQPVYSLNLVNQGLSLGDDVAPDEYYHHHAVVNVEHTDRVLEGFHFVFVDLEKFTPKTVHEKKMAVLWLRFLTEIDEHTQEVPPELLDNPDMRQALQILEKAGYNDAQLQAYSDFWMSLVDERVLREGSYKKGVEEGMAKGMVEGMAKGRAEGRAEGIVDTARNLKAMGLMLADISKATGLTTDEIAAL